MHVLTLVSRDDDLPALSARVAEALPDLLKSGPLKQAVRIEPLGPGEAVDLIFEADLPAETGPSTPCGGRLEAARTALRRYFRGHRLDFALQPLDGRRKSLLVADMESTVIANEMLDELADFVGLRPRIAAITERAMNGELDFEAALAERVGLLKDLPESILEECTERIVIDPGAGSLVSTLKAHGVRTALVSGGFTYFARGIQERLGFDFVQANELLWRDGRLTGQVGRPILDRQAKVTALDRQCAQLGIDAAAAATVGDGANDLSMLLKSGLGVAFHGKPQVAEAARFRIDHGDLSTLLYFQGYPRHAWS